MLRNDDWKRIGRDQRGQKCNEGRGWYGLKGACKRGKKNAENADGLRKASKLALADKIRSAKGMRDRSNPDDAKGSPGWNDKLSMLGSLGNAQKNREIEGDAWIESIKDRAKKGYKPEDAEWWASASYKDRKVISDQAEGWWADLSKSERKSAIKSAGVTIKTVGIQGINKSKVEDADSIFDFRGVQSDRMYRHFAKEKAAGNIRSLDQMINRKSGKGVNNGGTVYSRDLSRERDLEATEQAAVGGSLRDYLANSGFRQADVNKVMDADFSVPYFPKDKATGYTVKVLGSGLSRQIKRYLELNGGKLPDNFR